MKLFKLDVSLVEMVPLSSTNAVGIVDSMYTFFEDLGLLPNNIIAMAADTCNVMFGRNHSISQLLKAKNPEIFLMKCSCHSIHKCSQYASLNLPKIIEDVVRNICTHFSKSPLRRDAFKQFQDLVDCEKKIPISPGQTRWLTMEYAVRRVLEQFDALLHYFRELCKTNKTVTNDVILGALEEPTTIIYLHFLSFTLNQFNEFNTVFQSETPLLHEIRNRLEELIKLCANAFMENEYVSDTDPLTIDPLLEDKYLPLHEVYLGKFSLKCSIFYIYLMLFYT